MLPAEDMKGGHFHSGRFLPGQKVLQNWVWFCFVVVTGGGQGEWQGELAENPLQPALTDWRQPVGTV